MTMCRAFTFIKVVIDPSSFGKKIIKGIDGVKKKKRYHSHSPLNKKVGWS
jgi:hypothetical protein